MTTAAGNIIISGKNFEIHARNGQLADGKQVRLQLRVYDDTQRTILERIRGLQQVFWVQIGSFQPAPIVGTLAVPNEPSDQFIDCVLNVEEFDKDMCNHEVNLATNTCVICEQEFS
jgi:hypothetical protein